MEELSRHGRKALDALRDSESPSDAAVAEGMARLEAELGAGLTQPIGQAANAGVKGSIGAKLLLGTLLGAALVAGWLGLRPTLPDATGSTGARSTEPLPRVVVRDPRPSSATPPAPIAVPPDEVTTTANVSTETPATERPAQVSEIEDPKPATKNKRSADEGSNLEEELRLVRGAGTASGKGDHTQAMDLLAEHRRRFPRGVLAGERELTRAKTLCAMGKRESARKLARRYLAKHASSHLASRFAEVCK